MKPLKDIDDLLKRDFDIASDQDADQAGVRVWHRLQSVGASASEARLDKAQPAEPSAFKRKVRWVQVAAAAVLIMAAAVGSKIVWRPADAALYRVAEGDVLQGETIRSNGGGGAVLKLSDGSRVEMRSNSELGVERATDGIRIRLRNGGIIVNAAKQRTGHLYVQTNDVTVSVVGTVFLVNADTNGSRVAVIEGEVRVQQGSIEKTLRPGDQVATNSQMPSPTVNEEIAWSRNQEALALKLEQSVTLAVQGLEIKLNLLEVQQGATATRPANTPKWEATSVRQCGPGIVPGARGGGAAGTVAAGGVRIDPSFLRVTCMRLRFLIEDAYVKYLEPEAFRRRWIFPVSGGPDWLDTDLYSIDARPAGGGPVDRQTMGGPMLQALLEDRFKLKLRREVRQEPVYELRVVDGGFKLQPLKEGECEARKSRISREPSVPGNFGLVFPATSYTDADGRTVNACGVGGLGQNDPSPGARTLHLHGQRVYELTNYLSLDRIILDKTGIEGLFDIVVTYGADVSPMGNRSNSAASPVDVAPAQTPRAPSGADPVFAALEKQLGLKLIPTMGPRTYYVVDHVERPTPN